MKPPILTDLYLKWNLNAGDYHIDELKQGAKAQRDADLKWFVEWLRGFYCEGCSTPNFPTFVIPLKEWDRLQTLAKRCG